MKEVQSQSHHQANINHQVESHHVSNYQPHQVKKIPVQSNMQQVINTINKKDSQKQIANNKKCSFPQCLKRQILRLFFIPLLIVLFLLTIALTFKQNNYQMNDYFYSKNIQINRKIRGVVPPLNETKEDIFGQYRIGLVQYFSVDDRRMLQNFRVQMWRNESMRVSQIGKQDKCWSVYKLKFYSSTIFIERKQSQLVNITVTRNITNQNNSSSDNKNKRIEKDIVEDDKSSQLNDNAQNITQAVTNKGGDNKAVSAQTVLPQAVVNSSQMQTSSKQQSQSSAQKKSLQQITTVQVQQPLCQLQKWSRLNQILGNSHIWTFAEGNFYLMEFSQIEQDNNGVLIMKLIDQYPSNV